MANKRLNASIVIGGAITGSLRSAFSSAGKGLTQLGAEVRRLSTEQRTLSKGIETFGRMGRNVDGLRDKYAKVTAQLTKMRAATERLARVERAREANLAKRSQLRGQMVDAVALGMAAGAPIAAAVQFENAMLGVAKQLEGARDESGKLTQKYYDMGDSIQQLGRELPVSTNAIAEMVTAGLRMGVASNEVLDFVRATTQMSTAFELPEGELAESMGKIAGLFKIPIPAISDLADTINYLDDNAISKGGDIIEFLQRTGGVAGAVKVSGKEMAALGSTLLTLGETTETAGTSVNSMFAKLAASTKGTKQFRSAMGEIGMSLEKVQGGMQTDAMGTMQEVFAAISKRNPKDHLGLLVQLFGREHAPKLVKLVTGVGELRRQLELANGEAAKGSMGREFAARMETATAQWQISKNRMTELGVTIGSVLLPALNDMMKTVGPIVSSFAEWSKEHPILTKAIVATTTGLIALRIASLGFGYGLTFVKGAVLTTASWITKIGAGVTLATAKFGGLGGIARQVGFALVRTPWGAAVAGLVAAGVLVYREWDRVKSFFTGLWTGITEGLAPVQAKFAGWMADFPIIGQAFDAIGTAVSSAITWFGKLFAPVDHTAEQLKAAGTAGETMGSWIARGIELALTPMMKLIEAIQWVSNNIGGVIASVKGLASEGLGKVEGAWSATKNFFGMGDEPAAGAAGSNSSAPALPAPANARNGGTYNDNSQTNFEIVQQPGESQEQLMRRIMAENERHRAARARANMNDGASTQ